MRDSPSQIGAISGRDIPRNIYRRIPAYARDNYSSKYPRAVGQFSSHQSKSISESISPNCDKFLPNVSVNLYIFSWSENDSILRCLRWWINRLHFCQSILNILCQDYSIWFKIHVHLPQSYRHFQRLVYMYIYKHISSCNTLYELFTAALFSLWIQNANFFL